MKVLDLFSGIGGFSLGLERAGMQTIAFCEIDPFCRKVLKKHWPEVPIHEDIKTLDGKHYRGTIDVVCGGFPCQDLSQSGLQRGFDGDRSSLYSEMLRIIGECKPKWAIFENVTNLLNGNHGLWFSVFLNDLAAIGFDAQWHCISASEFNAAHARDRVWIIAYPNSSNGEGLDFPQPLCTHSEESRRRQHSRAIDACLPADDYANGGRDSYDVPRVMDRLRSLGNAVVPQIPELIGKAIIQANNKSIEEILKQITVDHANAQNG